MQGWVVHSAPGCGTTYAQNETLTSTFAGGKISRLDESHPDQAAFDAFFS
jgi:hypothetical protein